MTNQPFFSIIIPTYNVAPYIARCLRSCVNQSFTNIEILIVDDCGSDDSIAIAREFAKNDSRVKIIHNPKNLGLFTSRIVGEREARGSYILHLDGDDYLHKQACESIHSLVRTSQDLPDIIHFKISYQGTPHSSPIANLMHKLRYILPTQFSRLPLRSPHIAHNFFLKSRHFPKFTIWDKCYKASLVSLSLPFVERFIPHKLTMAEDMLKFFVLSALAQSYVSIEKPLYVYCLNHSSITQTPSAKRKKISDMSEIIRALHSLAPSLASPLSPAIARTMSSNLASLIILESRRHTPCGTSETEHLDQEGGAALESIASPLVRESTQESPLNSLSFAQDTTLSKSTLESTSIPSPLAREILAPLAPLVDSALIEPPKLTRLTRLCLRLGAPRYLLACALSLQYWNRSLTYIRITAFILSLGFLKL